MEIKSVDEDILQKKLVEQSVEQLVEQLVEPVQYSFRGAYKFLGEWNSHYGTLFIDRDGNFVGNVADEDWVKAHKQIIGRIKVDKKTKMEFEKISPSSFLDVSYKLKKVGPYGDFERFAGRYDDKWVIKGEGYIKRGETWVKCPEQSNIGNLVLYRSEAQLREIRLLIKKNSF